MKFLVILPLLVAAASAAPYGHIVDSRIGHSIPQGAHVIGRHAGHTRVSQTLIQGQPRHITQQGPIRIKEQVVAGTPAISTFEKVIETPIEVIKQHNSVIHTSREVPVVTRIAEQKLIPITTYRDVHSTKTIHESRPVSHITRETQIQRQVQQENIVHGHH